MPLSSADRTALEQRFDGAIPAHLLETRTAQELQAGHHRAMIRFSEVRVKDFTESLAKLEAMTDAQQPGRSAWIERTKQNIAYHAAEIEQHQAALAALMPEPLAVAAE